MIVETVTYQQAYSQPNMLRALILAFAIFAPQAVAVTNITISAEKLTHPKYQASNVVANYDLNTNRFEQVKADTIVSGTIQARDAKVFRSGKNGNGNKTNWLNFNTQVKQKKDKSWADAKLQCQIPAQDQVTWHCTEGLLTAAHTKLPFGVEITPKKKGFHTVFNLEKASFSDEAGLHAAEDLSGTLSLDIKNQQDGLHWQHSLQFKEGEVFWDPFYLSEGGHVFSGAGVITDNAIHFNQGHLTLNKIGKADFDGDMSLKTYGFDSINADFRELDLAKAYPVLFKPFLEDTAFDHTEIAGTASLKIIRRDKQYKSFHIKLHDVDIDDKNGKFAFYKVNADMPWDYDEAKSVAFNYQNGRLLNVPLGKTELQAEVNRYSVTSPKLTMPILDGGLELSGVSAARIGKQWYWHLAANILPISMPQLSTALNWPQMQGKVGATIPQVTYSGGILTVNGEMLFDVFSGTARVTNLTMHNPLSNEPLLHADMTLRNLDLDDLTRTYSFGAIEGKLDGDIANLEMDNWEIVKLDAKLYNSPGRYRKKISQRAVENISSLGGAGAVAALQRSFLRFFKNFNYSKIGLSCRLQNDVCKMDGVESTDAGYTIVKGSGIPAISVMGYNHSVAWSDLIARIKRITDENTKAIVK